MSNPAVIMLTNIATKSGGRFKVEDNIGESIHIHYDNLRIDLTVKEFLVFSETIEESLVSFINIENFDISNFDPTFLHDISHYLKDLEKISYDKMKLSQMIISRNGFMGIPKWSKLNESRVYRAIKGDVSENNNYLQNNLINQSNQDRVESIKQLIGQKGYPYNNEFLVFFNNQNYIRDGQHRASSLLAQHGDIEVPVIRLHFKNNKHNLSELLWLNSLKPILKLKIKSLVIRVIVKLRNFNKY